MFLIEKEGKDNEPTIRQQTVAFETLSPQLGRLIGDLSRITLYKRNPNQPQTHTD